MKHEHATSHDVAIERTHGERLADGVAGFVGSWKFIIVQSCLMMLWLIANSLWLFFGEKWDPYPFILLNLMLSFQAAFTGPIVLLSQNRQATHDRALAENDFEMDLETNEMLHTVLSDLKEIKQKLTGT